MIFLCISLRLRATDFPNENLLHGLYGYFDGSLAKLDVETMRLVGVKSVS